MAPSFRLYRYSGFTVIPIFPSFRRKPESTRCDEFQLPYSAGRKRVIPAKAGIYALRRTPVFAGMTAKIEPPRPCCHIAIYHSPASVSIIAMPLQPSFRRKPESRPLTEPKWDTLSILQPSFRLAPE